MRGLASSPHVGGELTPGLPAAHFLSSKPPDFSGDPTHFVQLMRYYRLFRDQAAALDPNVDSLKLGSGGGITVHEDDSPFVYPDACSVRSDCVMVSERLAHGRVAIIGLGGTGGYVLDQVAKTPVREIHLFDGDTFDMHNAFRAPGAATESDFGKPKVEYFKAMYSNMHKGIRDHHAYVTEANASLLAAYDYVFVCVDNGPARRLICSALLKFRVPFVDCGMDLALTKHNSLTGLCRVTVGEADKPEQFFKHAPTMEKSPDDIYDQNIQFADLNAINALLAVARWKIHMRFYASMHPPYQIQFTVDTMGLAKRDDRPVPPVDAGPGVDGSPSKDGAGCSGSDDAH